MEMVVLIYRYGQEIEVRRAAWIFLWGCLLMGAGCKKEAPADLHWWLAQAKASAGGIEDEQARNAAYRAITEIQLETGDIGGAKGSLELVTDGEKPWLLCEILKAQARGGDIKGAKASAAQIDNEFFQSLAYGDIASVQAEAGDGSGARATAGEIEVVEYQGKALGEIARALAERGDIMGAKEAAAVIEEPNYLRYLAYHHIVEAQAKGGDLRGAEALAADIFAEPYRSTAYGAMGKEQVEAGDITGAQATAGKMRDSFARVEVYCEIGCALAEWGDFEGALRMFQQAKMCAKYISGSETNVGVYRIIVKSLLQAGELVEAKDTAEGISDPYEKAWAYSDIASMVAKMEDADPAMALVELIEVDQIRDHTYSVIVAEQARRGRIERGRALAAYIKDKYRRVQAYCEIADEQAERGDIEAARLTLWDAENMTEIIQPPVVKGRLKIKDFNGAWRMARRINDRHTKNKIEAYRLVAKAQIKTGNSKPLFDWVEAEENSHFITYLYLGAAEGLKEMMEAGGEDKKKEEAPRSRLYIAKN